MKLTDLVEQTPLQLDLIGIGEEHPALATTIDNGGTFVNKDITKCLQQTAEYYVLERTQESLNQ